jgi:hypothetical protein
MLLTKQRMELFRLMLTAQDYGMTVQESREMASSRFHLDLEQVRCIEREGLSKGWADTFDGRRLASPGG